MRGGEDSSRRWLLARRCNHDAGGLVDLFAAPHGYESFVAQARRERVGVIVQVRHVTDVPSRRQADVQSEHPWPGRLRRGQQIFAVVEVLAESDLILVVALVPTGESRTSPEV